MHHSPSQYSVNSFSTENKYQQQTPQQLPRSVSRNQVTPQQQQQPSPRVNEVTVSKNTSLFNIILIFKICVQTKLQNTGFRHSTSEYEDVNQSTVRAAEIGAYPRSNKRSSMIQQPVVSNPLPPLPNKSPSSRSISTVASSRQQHNDTAFLEMILPMLDKVRI